MQLVDIQSNNISYYKIQPQKNATMSNYRIIIVSKVLDAPYNDENEVYDIINKKENGTL